MIIKFINRGCYVRPEEADLLGAGRRMLVPELRRKERKEDEEWYRVSRFQLDWKIPLWCSTEEYGDNT